MNKSFFQKKKRIPLFLVPKMRKRHVLPVYQDRETEWKLFAEGALRNQVFHEAVMNRGNKCLACNQPLITGRAKKSSHIEKHHHCYLRLCTGHILPKGSGDIYREANNPEYFEGCIKKIFPVHRSCHGYIHLVEKMLFDRLGTMFRNNFVQATSK